MPQQSKRRFRSRYPRVHLRWDRGPKLVLLERHQHKVKLSLRVVTVIGVATSIVSLPWWYALPLSLLLVGLEQVLERIIFVYTTMFIQPMPDFDLDNSKWEAMAFVVHPSGPNAVGLVFNDPGYARRFFTLLRSWNYGGSEDRENNIQLSFVIEEERYFVFLYPQFDRRTVRRFHEDVKEKYRYSMFGKEQLGLVVSLVICKDFSVSDGFGLGTFTEATPSGEPFALIAFLKSGDNPAIVTEIEPIMKWQYKSKHESYLTDEDFEYAYRRRVKG